MFRNIAQSSNSPSITPPSSYLSGLRPVASGGDSRSLSKRVSRTDLDFEQALRGDGTVRLREGPDISLLGVQDSPLSPRHVSPPPRQSSNKLIQPSTPIVVPPTPDPSTSNKQPIHHQVSPSPSPQASPSDTNEDDAQNKRRSLFRAPGTASSPDLATLIRKAKEKAGNDTSDGSRLQVPPSQSAGNGLLSPLEAATGRTRPRSSTASNRKLTSRTSSSAHVPSSRDYQTIGPSSAKGKEKMSSTETGSGVSSPNKDSSYLKMGKSSVRQKTTAFFGKLVGQGSLREKTRTRTTQVTSGRDPPPVPPMPDRFKMPTPESSSSSDVFYSVPSSPDIGKSLPTVTFNSRDHPDYSDSDNEDLESAEATGLSNVSPHTPTAHPKSFQASSKPDNENSTSMHSRTDSSSSIRKRSMSTGTVQSPSISTAEKLTMPSVPLPGGTIKGNDWDATLRGIMSNFDGFETANGGLVELKNPLLATPLKKQPQADKPYLSTDEMSLTLPESRGDLSRRTSLPQNSHNKLPTIGREAGRAASLDVSPGMYTPSMRPGIRGSGSSPKPTPMRNSQRNLPVRPSTANIFSENATPAMVQLPDTQRLILHNRSPASASEPSLLGMLGDSHQYRHHNSSTVRLVSSTVQHSTSSSVVATTSDTGTPTSTTSHLLSPLESVNSPGNDDLEQRGEDLARKCWNEDENFLAKEKIAEWLGGIGLINKVALRHYLQQFDFQSLRLDYAFRRLCAKLYIKAETQQVDRILEEFSRRYWECNPNTLYGSSSTVHAVAYSLLLLNTDLHVAELSSHMSRPQFVKNTLQAIRSQSKFIAPLNQTLGNERMEPRDVATTPSRSSRSGSITSGTGSVKDGLNSSLNVPPFVASRSEFASKEGTTTSPLSSPAPPSFTDSSKADNANDRAWENDMEALLKDLYGAIKNQQILQAALSSATERSPNLAPSHNLLRTGSRRGQSTDRLNTLKRGSIRGLQSLIVTSHGPSPYSSNSSVDGRISPSPSFATSNADAFSASSSSFFATPTYGFASNLTHTIIKEAEEADRRSVQSDDSDNTDVSVSDAELALLGPPFAKEGSLSRKQYWEGTNRRAKSKLWMDVFVVIQKGEVDMFTFGNHHSSNGQAVGGGNWLSNASHVGSLSLSHSLAHALPPPGYSRQRPHCFVLTLSTGAVYFFQAGTEDLVNEWVSTCNYWAARQSKEPLAGGVSNMEYGWNRVVPGSTDEQMEDHTDALSTRSSRSIFSKRSFAGSGQERIANSPYADRTIVNEWKPPLPPSVPSTLDEESQLEAMEKEVTTLNQELEAHQALYRPMLDLFLPRSGNASRALHNWKNKSQYLTSEIVKYDIYVDALKAAMAVRHKKRGEKALEKALVVDPDSGGPNEPALNRNHGFSNRDIIVEAEEPNTPGPLHGTFPRESKAKENIPSP